MLSKGLCFAGEEQETSRRHLAGVWALRRSGSAPPVGGRLQFVGVAGVGAGRGGGGERGGFSQLAAALLDCSACLAVCGGG